MDPLHSCVLTAHIGARCLKECSITTGTDALWTYKWTACNTACSPARLSLRRTALPGLLHALTIQVDTLGVLNCHANHKDWLHC